MKKQIPFNKPYTCGNELNYIREVLASGHLAGDGVFTRKCQGYLESRFGIQKAFLTTSCTTALEMAAILCEICPGDEVILPSFTFVSTANAFLLRGAKLVFIDIHPDTLTLDETLLADAITSKTKVIVPTHYAGIGCEMDTIMAIASSHGITVIEDAAQGVCAPYKDRYLGAIGDLGAYSFHETKNIVCGEGGALLINNQRFIERAEIIREKGTNRSKYFRGEVDKYTWVDTGSSYLPSDILAAFLYAQLEASQTITVRRTECLTYYYNNLQPLVSEGFFDLPPLSICHHSNAHMFYLIMKNHTSQKAILHYLKSHGINATFHYVPLHTSPIGRRLGFRPGMMPVTESISQRIVRLPLYYDLTTEDQDYIIDHIKRFIHEEHSCTSCRQDSLVNTKSHS